MRQALHVFAILVLVTLLAGCCCPGRKRGKCGGCPGKKTGACGGDKKATPSRCHDEK